MQTFSYLPINSLFFKHWHSDDTEIGVVIAKARFTRIGDGISVRSTKPPEIAFLDGFEADPAWSPLISEQDIAPGKIGTDLTLRAAARAPQGRNLSDWGVSLSIFEKLQYNFHVRGPSFWQRSRIRGWHKSTPELVSEVPINLSRAFGGRAPGPERSEVTYEFNPAGIGFVTKERLELGDDIPLPQIGSLADFMATDPLHEMSVHGFGPIAKAWLPRRSFAGTFDSDWRATRHPRMPHDYSLRFWNAAPSPLQLDTPLKGNEEISVTGISHASEPVRIKLPGVWCGLDLVGQAREQIPMVLDTVQLDFEDQDPRQHSAVLIWRAQVFSPHRFETAEVISGKLEE